MRVLLVEPYYSGSHQAWADGYAAASDHDVGVVTHAGTSWRWRMQGGALSLAAAVVSHVEEHGRPDVALVSGMVNLPALLGLARPVLDDVPVALYLHENQLTYPRAPSQRDGGDHTGHALTNWLSMAAADAVFVNSDHHLRALAEALPQLLRRFPDESHMPWLPAVLDRTAVLPVGIALRRLDGPTADGHGPPVVLWNARWEHDKAPEDFAAAIDRLAHSGADFRLAVCGERFGHADTPLDDLCRRHRHRAIQCGFAPAGRYEELLRQARVVVSTAHHEFFGIAVVEAMYAGAFPVLPRRLSYPELVPADLHAACLYDEPLGLDQRLARAVSQPAEATAVAHRMRRELARFDWSVMAPRYDTELEGVAAAGPGGGAAAGRLRRS